ncbi:MAG: hypothetical protein RLZZ524_2938, partial [Pseudomonadota bacterium]
VAGPTDLEGWVHNGFLSDQPPARLRGAVKAVAAKKAAVKSAMKVAGKKATRTR